MLPIVKKSIIAALVVLLGALGVAGGNRTIIAVKAWWSSLFERSRR